METNYPQMILHKSEGVSASEGYLIDKCKKTFLSLWSFPNVYKDEQKGKELCDVLAVFENHIFIFSDKNCIFQDNRPIETAWNRWYRHAIDSAANQIHGAERYLRQGRRLYLDAKLSQPFPFTLNISEGTKIHRIIVARGIKEACKRFFGGGSGSLLVDTSVVGSGHICDRVFDKEDDPNDNAPLFRVGLVRSRDEYIHIFDDFTLDCIMDELDTVSDFIDYLEEKETLILAGKYFFAAGEEDILAKYLTTVDNERHCIVPRNLLQYVAFCFEENWDDYRNSRERRIKKQEDKKSYLWDKLLEKTFSYMMSGQLRSVSHCDYNQQSKIFCRFARPNRIERRALSDQVMDSWMKAKQERNLTVKKDFAFTRRVIFPSHKDTMLTILWIHYPDDHTLEEFHMARIELIKAKILSYMDTDRTIRYHLGIAKTIEEEKESSEDFVYLDALDFPSGCEAIRDANEMLGHFSSETANKKMVTVEEYGTKKASHIL